MAVAESVVTKLAETFRGEMVRPEDATYDSARAIFNGMFDMRPALIARCTGVSDVIAAVQTARESGIEVAVRGGRHDIQA